MLKQVIFLAVLVLFISNPIFYNDAEGKISASLWIPEEILLKEQYFGLIVLDSKLESDTKFDIVTDNEEVIDLKLETVIIPKGKHHGIIVFETKGTGTAQIFAISQDTLLEENVGVVESADTPTQLDLILPSNLVNVLVDENKHIGYIFLLNEFENPVIADDSILVELTSNGEISLSKKSVIINDGQHYAKFEFQAFGEGTISATASNLELDEEEISLDPSDKIELKIAVAPDPIPTDSSGEVYFWLERDGKPYLPPHDVQVTISIDKSANLSFDPAIEGAIVLGPDSTLDRRTNDPDAKEIITRTDIQLEEDSEREIVLKKGQHYGRIQVYASFDDAGGIGISGLAESINPQEDEETIKVSEIITVETESSNNEIATGTQVLAFPDPAYNTIEIIVSSSSEEGPVIEDDDEEFTVFTNNLLQLDFQNPKTIKTDENYAIITAKVVDFGTAEIFAERNEAESDELDVETEGKYVKDPELDIVPFPILYNTKQDLFLVTSSQEKIITDALSEEEGNLVSITSRPSFEYDAIQESEAVIRIQGKISELLEDEPKVSIASNAFTETETLDVYNPDRTKLQVSHPNNVYPNEPFPIVTHITDLEKNLVQKSKTRVSSMASMSLDGDLVYINQTGSHGIIFYDKNSVPVESNIVIRGAPVPVKTAEQIEEEKKRAIFTYDLNVVNGQGSGEYEEDTEVTISAEPTIDDYFVIKKKFVGWKNLPFKDSTVSFEIDDDVDTEPIYEDDYTMLISIVGPAGGVGALIFVKKKKNGAKKESDESDEDKLLEDILKGG